MSSKYLQFIMAGLAIAVSAASAQSGFEFVSGPLLDPQGRPETVAIGDLNGDGRNDIVAINNTESTHALAGNVVVFLQDASGQFGAPIAVPFDDSGVSGWGLAILDLDGDEDKEIVAGYFGGLLLIDMQGSAPVATEVVTASTLNDLLAPADLDHDGIAELLALNTRGSQRTLRRYEADGEGGLIELSVQSVSGDGFDLDLGDLNSDGFDDLALMNGGSTTFSDLGVYPNDGTGQLLAPTYYDDNGFEITSNVAVLDINADGRQDVVLASGHGLRVYQQTFSGTLVEAMPLDMQVSFIEAADLDGNGFDDIVGVGDDALVRRLQDASGLGPESSLPLLPNGDYERQTLALGDVNGDNCTDAVVADLANGVVVAHGTGCVARADLAVNLRAGARRVSTVLRHLDGDPATGSQLQVRFSSKQQFLVDAPAGCGVVQLSKNEYQASCPMGTLTAGQSRWVSFSLMPSPASPSTSEVFIEATVNSDALDTEPKNNSASRLVRL